MGKRFVTTQNRIIRYLLDFFIGLCYNAAVRDGLCAGLRSSGARELVMNWEGVRIKTIGIFPHVSKGLVCGEL